MDPVILGLVAVVVLALALGSSMAANGRAMARLADTNRDLAHAVLATRGADAAGMFTRLQASGVELDAVRRGDIIATAEQNGVHSQNGVGLYDDGYEP